METIYRYSHAIVLFLTEQVNACSFQSSKPLSAYSVSNFVIFVLVALMIGRLDCPLMDSFKNLKEQFQHYIKL